MKYRPNYRHFCSFVFILNIISLQTNYHNAVLSGPRGVSNTTRIFTAPFKKVESPLTYSFQHFCFLNQKLQSTSNHTLAFVVAVAHFPRRPTYSSACMTLYSITISARCPVCNQEGYYCAMQKNNHVTGRVLNKDDMLRIHKSCLLFTFQLPFICLPREDPEHCLCKETLQAKS